MTEIDHRDAPPVSILTFEDEHAAGFARLNREWLESYNLLEEGDLKHLEYPGDSIISTGGEIFVAVSGGDVVGTCAAIVRDGSTVEMAKLSVALEFRGRGLGERLSRSAIDWARDRGFVKVVLVSSTRLKTALKIYERLGFEYAELPEDPGYESADVYMELRLK